MFARQQPAMKSAQAIDPSHVPELEEDAAEDEATAEPADPLADCRRATICTDVGSEYFGRLPACVDGRPTPFTGVKVAATRTSSRTMSVLRARTAASSFDEYFCGLRLVSR